MSRIKDRSQGAGGSYLLPAQLAQRWGIGERTLANWRLQGAGCSFVKLGHAVRYRLEDVCEYEETRTFKSTTEAQVRAARGKLPTGSSEGRF